MQLAEALSQCLPNGHPFAIVHMEAYINGVLCSVAYQMHIDIAIGQIEAQCQLQVTCLEILHTLQLAT